MVQTKKERRFMWRTKGQRPDIPFTEAKAVWRTIVAWGWGAVHLVGHVRPWRALQPESKGKAEEGASQKELEL